MEEYTEGMVIQTGAKVASIATNNDELEIVTTVSEADATKIKKGDKVDVAVSGLTQSVYGTISGEVVSKDTDVSVTSTASGSVAYFKLVVKPDYNYVISKAGDKVNLSNGMCVEARIQ
jgi:multidrug resistance efflux pump